MYVCHECGSRFGEPIQYNSDNVSCINYGNFLDWCDYENEDVCPYCYSMDIEAEREYDED